MTATRKTEIRALAQKHVGKNRSAGIILECLTEIDRLQNLYCIALDAAYKNGRQRGVAINKLKALAEN